MVMIHRIQRACLLLAAAISGGCGFLPPPAPQYDDPFSVVPKAAGEIPTSNLRLGLTVSENAVKSMAYVTERHRAYKAYGPFTNVSGMEDEDPAKVVPAMTEVLQRRFKSVVRLDSRSPAELQKVDVAMVLDMQFRVGSMSGQKTEAKLTGVFLDPQGGQVDVASGQGETVVPYPARNAGFRAAWQAALRQFDAQLGASQKLSALGLQKADGSAVAAAGPAQREQPLAGPVAQRWAVVVGISKYKYADKRMSNLQYAAKDAEDLAAFLKSPQGGSFPADHVLLLTDAAATKQAITDALFTFLKHTVKEDLVIIYFSGHGSPDPEKLSNLYIVAHDTNIDKIASTGVPMWDLDTAMHRTIAAQRVIVMADTCHSAGVTEGVKGVQVGESFNRYFEALSRSRPGRVTFTSCEGYEVSRESEKWGGGHGVFTWALLEAIGGKGDTDKNGIVTLGEMLDYVDIIVRRETANEQHPARAGVQFDRNLPMGIVK
jgi:uncharacterized caspase-like protein